MPKQLPIIINPNPLLRKKSLEVSLEKINNQEFQELLLDIEETMTKKDGAGLAAPQVGKNIRALAILHGKKVVLMINPQITKKSWARKIDEEGCLSVLDDNGEIIYGLVERHKKINCVYWDKTGKKKKIKAENMLARIIQHEIDHLDGILFIDKLAKKK